MSAPWLFAQRCAIVLTLLIGARVARPVLVPLLLAALVCMLAGDRVARSPRAGSAILGSASIALLPLALLASSALLLGELVAQGAGEIDAARAVLEAVLDVEALVPPLRSG